MSTNYVNFSPPLKCRAKNKAGVVCGHEWLPRSHKRPDECPKCKNRNWDKGA